jgi:DNA-binding response OmpR family regulator
VKAYFPVDPATPADAEPASRAGDEMVLVVEDEEPVRELLRKLLASQGYRVLEARHGMDAIRILERHRGPVDLMITDVVMPEIDGLELTERVRMTRPDLPVLFISGYTSDEVMRRGAGLPSGAFVHKPFASDDLLAAVRRLLDAASAPAA